VIGRLVAYLRWRNYRPWEVWLMHVSLLGPALTALALSFAFTAEQLESGDVQLAPCFSSA
jgi:hypothetical protein